MLKCPGCEYRTTKAKQMAKHVENTKHGMQRSTRENKSYLSQKHRKKKA
jgi:uncharacterized C2H2 Zn-finger protein